MNHLLDVNALIALAFDQHVHHARMGRWVAALQRQGRLELATCALTELGFVRIAPSARLCASVGEARAALAALKSSRGATFTLVPDDVGADVLPAWVNLPARTTDGHLSVLAARHGLRLATLDSGIPGSTLIP